MFFIFVLNCLLLVLIQCTPPNEKDNENLSDVRRINIKDLDRDKRGNPGKEIIIDGSTNEKAIVFPKQSLFSKDFKVTECTGSRCTSEKLSEENRMKINKCHFEGHIISDPDSKVSVVDCMTNGGKDISIVSEKTNLTFNNYRINSKGNIETPKSNFSDVLNTTKHEDDDDSLEIGNDYSNVDTTPVEEFEMFFDKRIYTVIDVDSKCCRPILTICKKLSKNEKTCTVQKGKILCEKGEFKHTCLGLKDYVKKRSREQKKNKVGNKKEAHKKNKSKEASNIGNGVDISEEEGYDYYAYDYANNYNDKQVYLRSKQIGELSKSELVNLIREINAPLEKGKTNPKCGHLERRMHVISIECLNKECRTKAPVPKEKIYSERTIEIGAFIDKHLYKKMSEDIKSSDNEKIKEAIVQMVHGLLVEVEMFLKHKTFTTLDGGFKLAINGIHIHKEHDDALTRQWDEGNSLEEVLKAFKAFSMKMNGVCDADENSYDAMILFTGRTDFTDVNDQLTSSTGFALRGDICKIAPATVLMLRLDGKGSPIQIASRLMAHEMGHLLGSDHDSENGQFLMAPTVGSTMTTWSTRTQKMIDAEYQRREKEGKNCLFT